jgi:hypothetical protein
MNEISNKGRGENRRPKVKALIFVHAAHEKEIVGKQSKWNHIMKGHEMEMNMDNVHQYGP